MYDLATNQNIDGRVHSFQMRCGGLPQHTEKGGDLHYGPVFSPEGLKFEYERPAYSLRNKILVTPTTFTDPEYWEESDTKPLPFGINPFPVTVQSIRKILEQRVQTSFIEHHDGMLFLKGLQARPTADGTSTMCFDERYRRKVTNLEYKTLRFEPHYQTWFKMQREGTLDTLISRWKNEMNSPAISGYPDMALLRVWAKRKPESHRLTVELMVLHDDEEVGNPNAFTAMQHLTGWPTVFLALALLRYPPGSSSSKYPSIFRDPNYSTSTGRMVESTLLEGGVIAPFELLDAKPLLEMLEEDNRIPLIDLRYPQE